MSLKVGRSCLLEQSGTQIHLIFKKLTAISIPKDTNPLSVLLQSKTFKQWMQSHWDCSIQHALLQVWQMHVGPSQSPYPLQSYSFNPIFSRRPWGKSCQHNPRTTQSLETGTEVSHVNSLQRPQGSRSLLSAAGTHHLKFWAYKTTEVLLVSTVQLKTQNKWIRASSWL